jgi:hypothetical protein
MLPITVTCKLYTVAIRNPKLAGATDSDSDSIHLKAWQKLRDKGGKTWKKNTKHEMAMSIPDPFVSKRRSCATTSGAK